jgi:hypothetical protein
VYLPNCLLGLLLVAPDRLLSGMAFFCSGTAARSPGHDVVFLEMLAQERPGYHHHALFDRMIVAQEMVNHLHGQGTA